jgi:hypothetical protein
MNMNYNILPMAYDGPEEIYLQWDDAPGEEITWCQDRINESDVKYVLESSLNAALLENKLLHQKLFEIAELFFKAREVLFDTMTNEQQEEAANV